MRSRLLTAILPALALAACGTGDSGLRNLDAELAGPDEFSILPSQPIVIPDTLALPQPTPGGANRTDQNPAADALVVLGGSPASTRAGGIPAQDAPLVAFAARNGTDPSIRQTLAQEDADFRARAAGGLSLNLLGRDQYFSAYARAALDAYDELARLRALGVTVPTAPPLR